MAASSLHWLLSAALLREDHQIAWSTNHPSYLRLANIGCCSSNHRRSCKDQWGKSIERFRHPEQTG